MSYTYALLAVSDAAYDEIAGLLRDAGYTHVFGDDGEIDMHGLALERLPAVKGGSAARGTGDAVPVKSDDGSNTASEPTDEPLPAELPFVVLSEWAARTLCNVHEVAYAPVDGKQVVGGVLLHILNEVKR